MNEPLPQGWAWATVGEVATEVRSGFASGKHNPSGDGIPHLRPMNVSRGGEVDLTKVKYVSQDVDERRLCRGDILFNNTNSPALVGKTALFTLDGEFAFSNHMTRVRTSEMVPGFISYQLHHVWMSGRQSPFINNHVNQASISARVLASQIQIAVAPVSEQRRIVDRIGEIFARLHAAETRLKSLLEKLNHLRSAILADAFHTTGALPNGWQWAKLAQVCNKPQYGWTTKSAQTDGLPYLRTTDISSGSIDWASVPSCVKQPTNIERFLLNDGDIVVSRAGSVGISHMLRDPPRAVFASYLIRLRVNKNLIPKYLAFYLKSPAYWKAISENKIGIAIPNVNAKKLADIPIPVPSRLEQQATIARVESEFLHLDAIEDSVENGLKQVVTLRQSVLAEAFAGRLVPQDPDDEPASVLLKRIAATRPAKKPKCRRKARS